jgi:hypothetical protein
VSEIDVMKDILVAAPDTMTGGRFADCRSSRCASLELVHRAASDEGGESGGRRSECQSNTDTIAGGRPSEWRSIADGLGRCTVSTIEPVTIQAAGLARRPVPLHDKGTPA